MDSPGIALQQAITRAAAQLGALASADTLWRPHPNAWSAREILGHLVDSAVNNLPRFVEGRERTDLVFPGYDQDAWVAAQQWQLHDWPALVSLWLLLNQRVVAVMQSTPTADLERPRHPHSLHRIAWQPVPEAEPATLGYLMRDYVGHLEHHLGELFRLAETARRVQSGAGPGFPAHRL